MSSAFQKEVSLSEFFSSKQVLPEMSNRSKKAAIDDLVDCLYQQKRVANKSEAGARVMEREELLSTALGDGVAIPHARIEVGDGPAIAVGRHPAGLDFDAPDGNPVHLIVLVLWQPEQPGLFNRLFAGLVKKLADPAFRAQLIEADGAKGIADILADVRIDMIAGQPSRCEADMLITLQLLESKRCAGAKNLARQIELARAELPQSMLSRVDRLINLYGEALVEATGGSCCGCNMQLSTKFASELLRNPHQIYVCERCGRFLIHHLS